MSIFNHRVGDAHSGENTMKTIYWRKSRNRTPTHYQGFACHNIRIAPFGKKSKSAKDTARHDKQQVAHTHSKSSNNSNFNSNTRTPDQTPSILELECKFCCTCLWNVLTFRDRRDQNGSYILQKRSGKLRSFILVMACLVSTTLL
jgi:hypothetical protein